MARFKIRDRVVKPRGYAFDGWIVAVFENRAGQTRVVAENHQGLLHIFNEEQLEPDLRPEHESTTLVDRLRGVYHVPINDGAGPLDGSNTFTRRFDTAPIQHEAAHRIVELERRIRELEGGS